MVMCNVLSSVIIVPDDEDGDEDECIYIVKCFEQKL